MVSVVTSFKFFPTTLVAFYCLTKTADCFTSFWYVTGLTKITCEINLTIILINTNLPPWFVLWSTLTWHFLPHWCSQLLSDRWRRLAGLPRRCYSQGLGLCFYWLAVLLGKRLDPTNQSWWTLASQLQNSRGSVFPLVHVERLHTLW